MHTPSVLQIIKAMGLKGYRVYDDPAGGDLNIVGIRSVSAQPNQFDDLLVVFFFRGPQLCYWFAPCTTDPGQYWLQNPIGVDGTAILKEGQYKGAYHIGLHQGKYEALVQRGPLTVIRDADRDSSPDTDNGTEQSGLFGINIHCAAWQGESTQVDQWSAGCQVIANWYDFQVFISLCRAGASRFGNKFTYTLLHQRDFGIIS
jgi:hypothetical protein